MLPASAGKPSWREPCKRKSSHRERADTSFGKQSQLILPATAGSHDFHPLVPAAAEKQQAIFFSLELSVLVLSVPISSGHGKNEPFGPVITGFLLSCSSVTWPALEIQSECGQSVCSILPMPCGLQGNRQIIHNILFIPGYRNLGLLWQLCLEAKAQYCRHTEHN